VYQMLSFPRWEESESMPSPWTSSCSGDGPKPKRKRAGYILLRVVESTIAIYMPRVGSK
jgi:hypothetical protein